MRLKKYKQRTVNPKAKLLNMAEKIRAKGYPNELIDKTDQRIFRYPGYRECLTVWHIILNHTHIIAANANS